MVMKEGTKSIYFRIPEQLKLRIEMEAVRQGRSVNNLLKYIVEEYLKEQKKQGTDFSVPQIFIIALISLQAAQSYWSGRLLRRHKFQQ